VNKQSELLHHVRTTVIAAGATIISVDSTGGGHRVILFEINGHRGRFFFSTSPRRGFDLNAITGVRRVVRATSNGEHRR
jgi:hypothetical protein